MGNIRSETISSLVMPSVGTPVTPLPPTVPPRELQQLWFATLKRPWSSLVVVPAHPGDSTLEVAQALASVGALHRSRPARLIDAAEAELKDASRLILEMTSHVNAGSLVVVSVQSVVQNQAGIPLALAADAVLLSVALGEADFASAERTV